jgi:hypothetical protein
MSLLPTMCALFLWQGIVSGYTCDLSTQPVVFLAKDTGSGDFFLVEQGKNATKLAVGQVRSLSEDKRGVQESTSNVRQSTLPVALFNETLEQDIEFFQARECGCFQPKYDAVFCPLAVSMCQTTTSGPLQCVSDSRRSIAGWYYQPWYCKSAALFGTLFFFGLCYALFCGQMGGNAMVFLVAKLMPSWNENAVDRFIEDDPVQARAILDTYFAERPEELPKKKRKLMLKTKIYAVDVSSSASDENGEEDCTSEHAQECSICFGELENGDRVGALSCKHIFRKYSRCPPILQEKRWSKKLLNYTDSDCLVRWVKQRNGCPLCQAVIALPHSKNTTPCEPP